jgi:hypothetical protein
MNLFALCVFRIGGSCVEAQAAPGLGDDDAVGRIVRIVTDLDGQVDAQAADVVGQSGDYLAAFVGDAGDTVVVDDDLRRARKLFVGCGDIADTAVGDTANVGEEIAAIAFYLFHGKSWPLEKVPGKTSRSHGTDGNDSDIPRRSKRKKQLGWISRKHSLCPRG